MRIENVELRRLRLPLVRPFETSFGRVDDRTFLLVTVHGGGETGWAECVAEASPFYSSETAATAWHILRDFLVPLVREGAFASAAAVWDRVARVRGHQMAKAALEMAVWDLEARQQGVPLWQRLGGNGRPIASGVSIGIQPSIEALESRVAAELADGYQRVKIKIKPGWDIEPARALRARYPRLQLMVDANAAYSLDDASHLAALDELALMMIEQPLEYDDVGRHAVLQARLTTPICLDESIHSLGIAEDAIARGACRIINIKPGRVGGHLQSIALHDLCAASGVPVWHGGMLESGIGRAHNLHLSTLPNFTLPGDVAASRRYYAPDLIEPGIDVRPDGTIEVPAGPGIGVVIDEGRVKAATEEYWCSA
ncbi:MAG: o-succinylbenzoate synthase [Acidobacteriota bacterium]|nr:o-succinylbenzoate synthase [Acidobacteriota bacterium]